MQRQDDFLRTLLTIIKINIEAGTTDYGFRVLQSAIEERLPTLKPVAYENMDLSTGLSGGGVHHICGDKASIARVQLALHNEEAFRPYVLMHRELQERLAKISAIITL